MTGFIRRYQKQMMAVSSVLLMIVFLLTSSVGRNNNAHGGSDAVVGDMNGTKVYGYEMSDALQQWRLLSQIPIPSQNQMDTNPRALTTAVLGEGAARQIDRDPGAFLLLQKEAAGMGLKVNSETVDALASELELPQSDDDQAKYKAAITNLMLVKEELDQISSAIKVSQPMVQYAMATTMQKVALKVVEFDAKDYLSQVAAPTTQAIENQYNQFSTNLPDQFDPVNDPMGFGYKYPNRVKYDYLGVSHDDVKAMIVASQPDVEWKAEALHYIHDHPDEFPAAPTTAPTTGPSTAPAAASATPGIPTKDQIQQAYDTVINQAVDAKVKEITARLTSMMNTDYVAWENAQSPTAAASTATTEPSSSFGVPYDTDEYLRRLAASVHDEFGLTPMVIIRSDDWLSEKDLAAEPEIGTAKVDSEEMGFPAFPVYATHLAAAFLSDAMKNDSRALQLQQPSLPMTDDLGNTYIFRLTEVNPAAPAPQDKMSQQVRDDLKTAAAFDLAATQAQSLADKCITAGVLPVAAKTLNKTVIVTKPFELNPDAQSIEGLSLKPASIPLLIAAATDLLKIDPQTGATPVAQVVRLEPDRMCMVIALDQVHPDWTSADQDRMKVMVDSQLRQDVQDQVLARWCSSRAVMDRLKYHPVDASKSPT